MSQSIYRSMIIPIVMVLPLLTACHSSRKVTIFDVGDSRDGVMVTILSDFKVDGEKPTKEWVLAREDAEGITMYDCEYRGQPYKKVKVYYREGKVHRIDLTIDKATAQDVEGALQSAYGAPHRATFTFLFGTKSDADVFIGDVEAVVLMEVKDFYVIRVVSGELRDELMRQMHLCTRGVSRDAFPICSVRQQSEKIAGI